MSPDLMLFSTGGKLVVGTGPFENTAGPPASGTAFYHQNYALDRSKPWWTPAEVTDRLPDSSDHPHITWNPLSSAPFARVFSQISAAIQAGELQKSVPVVVQVGEIESGHPRALARRFTNLPPHLRAFGWWNETTGMLGATPEVLFALDGPELKTMALAGTAKADEREVFAVDAKEIREHEFVAESLLAKLEGLGGLKRGPREVLDLGDLVHFQTLLELTLRNPLAIAELVALFHPTPALGPLPRSSRTLARAIAWRNALHCPEDFGAPFGLWQDGKFEVLVSIRLIAWNGREALLPSGCGIIQESRLVNEWRELRLKREAVRHIFGV